MRPAPSDPPSSSALRPSAVETAPTLPPARPRPERKTSFAPTYACAGFLVLEVFESLPQNRKSRRNVCRLAGHAPEGLTGCDQACVASRLPILPTRKSEGAAAFRLLNSAQPTSRL